jgi:hypothetical protein
MNKMVPHVLVLPEDDANRQLANGFQLDYSVDARRIQILEVAGGWREVVDGFKEVHVPEMERNTNRFMILLLDFDRQENRLQEITAEIPAHLHDRVFVLGSWSEPEELRQTLGSYETIGLALAKDCRDNRNDIWTHGLLKHNAGELDRLRLQVRPILFGE